MSDIDEAEEWIRRERDRELDSVFGWYVREMDPETKAHLGLKVDEALERRARVSKRRDVRNGSTGESK